MRWKLRNLRDRIEIWWWRLEQYLPDPDRGKKLRPEVEEYLRCSLEQPEHTYYSLEEVKQMLGLDD